MNGAWLLCAALLVGGVSALLVALHEPPSASTHPVARPRRLSRVWFAPLAAGVALGLVFVPYPWSWLAPLPLAILFSAIAGARGVRAAFGAGFAGGLGFFAVHLAWLPVSFTQLFGPVGAAPMPLLVVALAALWGACAALARTLGGRYTLLALPFAWVGLEFLRGLGAVGFTWGTLGYALLPTPAIQVADLGGVGLASLLVAASASALAALVRGVWRPALSVGLALTAALAYGLTRPDPRTPDRELLLVQGSIDPLEKARGRTAQELEVYERLTREGLASGARPALVVWPEGASPFAPTREEGRAALERLGVPALVGAPDFADGLYRNSAFGFNGGVTGRFDKVRLVPFGEFFPWRDGLRFVYDPIFAAFRLPDLRGATPGTRFDPIPVGTVRAGTYICYESTFPAVARALVGAGANLLVNISNDAWFGRTVGAEQHFQMGRVRAIETRRYLARAGNDGISAVIDPLGRVVARFPRGARAAFRAPVALDESLSPYVRFGDWPALVSVLALALIGVARLVRPSSVRP